MISLLIIISLLYFILIIGLIIGFNKIKEYKQIEKNDKNTFSIIIPFRNESSNLPELINSLNKLKYDKSKYEIIFIDDASTDNSVKIIEQNILKNIKYSIYKNDRKSHSPKKDAITTAIKFVKNKWIITTDADCSVPNLWLKTLNNFIENKTALFFIAAPVNYKAEKKFMERFQKLDFASLIGTTIGSFGLKKPIMCNGANLCYKKDAFLSVNGYIGNNNIVSGDDVFLMEKIQKKYPDKIAYLKSLYATVITKPEKNSKNLIEQRIRWASKAGNSKNLYTWIIGIIVLGINSFLSIFTFWYALKNKTAFYLIIIIWILKLVIDYFLIYKTLKLFEEKLKKMDYLLTAIIHPFFITVIFVLSLFKKYQWKDRIFYK